MLEVKKNKIILFFPSVGELETPRVPYALLYLERAVRDLGVEVVFIDENIDKEYHTFIESIAGELLLAGVSVMMGEQIGSCIDFSKFIRGLSDVPVIWGGWYPTQLPEQVLQADYVDLIASGPGESIFRELVSRLVEGRKFDDIKGLGHKSGNEIHINPQGAITEPSAWPHVNYELINLKNYFDPLAKLIGYNATIGCPFNCGFCSTALIFRHKWLHKEVSEIVDDLIYFKKNLPELEHITFEDDNFFSERKFIMDFSQAMIDKKIGLKWSGSAHASLFLKLFSAGDANIIRSAGCTGIYIGAESGDQRVLDLINKKTWVADNLRFVHFLTDHDIQPAFSTMFFFPGKPKRDMMKTISMIVKAHLINPHFFCSVNFYNPCPHTPLYELAQKHGFTFPQTNEGLVAMIKKGIDLPWVKKRYIKMLYLMKFFYFPLSDRNFYQGIRNKPAWVRFIYHILFSKIKLRARLGFFCFPLEGYFYLFLTGRSKRIKGKLFDERSSFRKIMLE